MLAIDTNVIVRYLADDHPRQSAQAKALIDGHDVFVATTVLLETERVLRGVYGFEAPRLAEALRAFAGLPRVTLEDEAAAARALDWMAAGMDFADALHVAKSSDCEAFVSFDKRLLRAAARLGGVKVRTV
jgi:predicted nucleic-acid-binding protein